MSTDTDHRLEAMAARLRAAGCVFAEDEARLLLRHFGDEDALEAAVRSRCAGTPLEHLLGWAAFGELSIAVRPGVFVPRPRSALLVRCALAHAGPGPLVVDLCCGSGAIGAAIAAGRPAAEVHGVDIDPAAVACARGNLAGVRGHVHVGDLYAPLPARLRGRVDLIVANAPYVPSAEIAFLPAEAREHEPRQALDGGPDGVDLHRRIAAGAGGWLRDDGRLLIETGPHQAALTATAFTAHGLRPRMTRDDAADATVVIGSPSPRDDISW